MENFQTKKKWNKNRNKMQNRLMSSMQFTVCEKISWMRKMERVVNKCLHCWEKKCILLKWKTKMWALTIESYWNTGLGLKIAKMKYGNDFYVTFVHLMPISLCSMSKLHETPWHWRQFPIFRQKKKTKQQIRFAVHFH